MKQTLTGELGAKTKYMELSEFVSSGVLFSINRLLLHPLGLALEVEVDANGNYAWGGIQDWRDDPEGIVFTDITEDSVAKAERFEAMSKRDARQKAFGWNVQPLPGLSAGQIESAMREAGERRNWERCDELEKELEEHWKEERPRVDDDGLAR